MPESSPVPNCPLITGLRPCECDLPRCPECNYTKHDAQFEGDHDACPGEIPTENPVVSVHIEPQGYGSRVSVDGVDIPLLTNIQLAHPAGEIPHLKLDVVLLEPLDLTFPASVFIDFQAIQPLTLIDVSTSDEGTRLLVRHGVEQILTFEDLDVIARVARSKNADGYVADLLDIINRLAGVKLSDPSSTGVVGVAVMGEVLSLPEEMVCDPSCGCGLPSQNYEATNDSALTLEQCSEIESYLASLKPGAWTRENVINYLARFDFSGRSF